MGRKKKTQDRGLLPDPRFHDLQLSRFINKIMLNGKKGTAERIVYGAMEQVEEKLKKDPLEVFKRAIENVKPVLEVKSRRVGGANYQVPIEVRTTRQEALSMRWIIGFARGRKGSSMSNRLAKEFMDAFNKTGDAVKKKEDTHRMAEANKAFAHYRW